MCPRRSRISACSFPFVTIGLRAGDVRGATIEQNASIGTGAKVIGGVRIGAGAVVGANAVVGIETRVLPFRGVHSSSDMAECPDIRSPWMPPHPDTGGKTCPARSSFQ